MSDAKNTAKPSKVKAVKGRVMWAVTRAAAGKKAATMFCKTSCNHFPNFSAYLVIPLNDIDALEETVAKELFEYEFPKGEWGKWTRLGNAANRDFYYAKARAVLTALGVPKPARRTERKAK
jgi:hypothetical protein